MNREKARAAFEQLLHSGKGTKWIVLLGAIGIGLIFLSSVLPKKSEPQQSVYSEFSNEAYTAMLEERLCDIVSQITGAQHVSVMLTLESGVERVYANQLKRSADLTQDETDGGSLKKQNDTTEESYIMVEDENGNKTALLLTSLTPNVGGVVIVCDGGDNPGVQENVRESVKTVLNISGSRVCVVGRNS